MLEKSTYYVLDAQGNQLSMYEHEVDQQAVNYTLAERNIYGSARLGRNSHKIDLYTADIENPVNSILGEKYYELSNHLGNVLAVINDVKYPVASGTTVDYFEVALVSVSDYSPFGVQLDGRTHQSDEYRYGFNGMEKDDEVKGEGNSINFGARIHDPRVGRWLSKDPKWKLFANISPYTYSSNNPVYYKDKAGEVIEPATDKSKTSFNNAVLKVFGEGEVANMLTITGDKLEGISMEDYQRGIESLNDVDQRAAFRGLVLAANDETVFMLDVVNSEETTLFQGESRKGSEFPQGIGIGEQDNTYVDELNPPRVDIAVNEDKDGVRKNATLRTGVKRSKEAMILGSVISAFSLHNNNENVAEVNKTTSLGIVHIQSENIFSRILHGKSMTADPINFKDSNNIPFTESQQERVSLIPAPIVFENIQHRPKFGEGGTIKSNEISVDENKVDD